MTTIVHFEVYVYDDVRGWSLQARYPGDERELAVEEAKMLEFTINQPVRVVRETYYPSNNASEEVVTYVGRLKPSEGQAKARPGAGLAGSGNNRGLDAAPFSERDIARMYAPTPRKAKATADFAFRLIVVMIASLTVAIVGTGVLSMLGADLFATLALQKTTQSLIMFLIFMGLFLLSALPLVMLYVPLDSLRDTKTSARTATRSSSRGGAPTKASRPKMNVTADQKVEAAVAAQAEDDAGPSGSLQMTDGDSPEASAEDAESAQAGADSSDDLDSDFSDDQPPPSKADDDPADAPLDNDTSDALDVARLVMMKFLGGAVNAIKTVRPQLDAYNRFGINLYLAGACDALAEARRLTRDDYRVLVQEAVEVIGTRNEHANQLIGRLDSYKTQARYRQMIAAGKVSMEVHLSGSSDPFIAISGVIKDWNTPQAQQVASRGVTIVFTDMVGSTDITHTIGDAAAQNIIRAHNHIVRGALMRHRGKEVKHTGDGIMASFDSEADAVVASVEIQRKAAEHTAKWPSQPLELRIGMNTGEPIIEENDYFGATVQVAARVCAIAGTAQVWISADTYAGLPRDGSIKTFNHGAQKLKGVQGETGLYEVIWNDARQSELAVLAAEQAETADRELPADATPEAAPSMDAAPAASAKPAAAKPAAAERPTGKPAAPSAPVKPPRPRPNMDRMPPPPTPRTPQPPARTKSTPRKNG